MISRISTSFFCNKHHYRSSISEGCGAWKRLCHSANAYQSEGCEEDDEKSSILESSNLQHWFKNWQELRRNKLTASTFAGAVGFWPGRRVQLWLEKIGARKPFQGNIATSWSNIKEEEALERYKLITGNPILFPDFCVQPNRDGEEDWLGCSADGVIDRVVYDLPFHGVLEIKCPYFDGDKEKMYPWSRLPLYCIPQAQGLMEILDKDWMDFYCWTINGSSLFRLHRDPEYWELMKIALSDFWWDHVAPAKELYRQHRVEKPLIEMKVLKPAAKHELCPAIVLASKYLVDESELVMREIHGRLQEERCWDFPQLKHDQMLTEKCKHVDTRNRWFWRYEEMGG